MNPPHDLAEALAQLGGAAGGGSATAAGLALVAASCAKDLARVSRRARERGWHEINPIETAATAAPFGALFGFAVIIFRWTGLN